MDWSNPGASITSAVSGATNAVSGYKPPNLQQVAGYSAIGGPFGTMMSPLANYFSGGGGGGSPSFDNSSMPQAPNWAMPGSTSNLGAAYTLQAPQSVNVNTQGIEALRNEALTPSSQSPWLKNQLNQITLQRQNAMDNATKQAASGTGAARASLMARGGLGSGAAERLALGGAQNQLLAQQGVGREASQENLAAGQAAEQNRLNTLNQLPRNEVAMLAPQFQNIQNQQGANEFNIRNQLGELNNQRQLQANAYQNQLANWAAQGQANAIQNSGGPSNPYTNIVQPILQPFGINV